MIQSLRPMCRIFTYCFVVIAGLALGQTPKFTETMIPVRDGQSLAADLYILDSTVEKPTILIQLPYNKNVFRFLIEHPEIGGIDMPYDSSKYNYVIVDWRGFYG